MRISDFVTQLSSGMARTNRFTVMITLPNTMSGQSQFNQLLLFCDQVQLPGVAVNTVPNRTFGEIRETPTEFNYEPINLSFYVDSTMYIKRYFDDWLKSIQQGQSRVFNYYRDYICPEMQILVQDTLDKNRLQVSLYECYPKSVSAIQMDYAGKDVMKLSVQMIYKYWEEVTIEAGGVADQTGNNLLNGNQTRSLSMMAGDVNQLAQIPQEYFSNFNSFQSNLAQNLKSNPNNVISLAENQIKTPINSAIDNSSLDITDILLT